MAWTTPGTAVAGDVLTAAYWNTQVRDNLNSIFPTGAQPAVGLVFTTGTAYTNGNAVPFTSEDYDTNSFHSTVSNTTRITIPSGLAGTYLFEGSVMANYSSQVTYVEMNIRANGTMESSKSIRGGIIPWATGVSSNAHFKAGGIAYNCAAGDYFELMFTATGGTFSGLSGGLTTQTPTYFRAIWIAP